MKKKVKKLWLEALRSGEYKQGTNNLRSNDAFCCLGVLCDLHAKATNTEWNMTRNCNSYLGYTVVLPTAVWKWAGLPGASFELKSPSEKDSLDVTTLNDGGATFAQIADLIEAQL